MHSVYKNAVFKRVTSLLTTTLLSIIFRKISEIVSNSLSDFTVKIKYIKFDFRCPLGVYSASADSIAVFNGPTSKGREGKGRGEGMGKGGEGGKGMENGNSSTSPVLPRLQSYVDRCTNLQSAGGSRILRPF